MARFGRIVLLAALLLAAFMGVWPRLWAESGERAHYVHQAQAFLDGQLDIEAPFGDVATYNGRHYVIFPPFPALLITPLVAIFGEHTRMTVVSLLLTGLNVFVLRATLRRLEIERKLLNWLLAGFFLGTAYTTSLFQTYESWHFAHIVAVTCLLLAVYEALGKGRGWLVGLCCGLAFLSRHLCIYASVFLLVALWVRRREAGLANRLLHAAALCVAMGLCFGAYLWLNWARFGDPLETGYAYLPLEGFLAARVERYGMFHPAYVPFNLLHMFFQGFHIEFTSPRYLGVAGMDLFGTSITFASPFVFFAFLARWQRWLRPAAWLSIMLVIVHTAFYYNNGWAQTNAQRFTLDLWPVLIPLVALGAQRIKPHWWKAAIGYSIALNFVALFIVEVLKQATAKL
ncbi:MAG: glycosyl transferase family 39 [Planctomycetota bacterium]